MKNKRKILIALIAFIGVSLNSFSQEWSLQQCIDTAEVHNKKIQISKNDESISTEKNKELKSNLIPKISLNGDYKYYFELPTQLMPVSAFGGPEDKFNAIQFGVEHNINANLQINVPIYNPEIYGGIKATKVGIEVSSIQTKRTKEEVYLEITNLYYNAQIIKNQIIFVDSNLSNSLKLLEHVKAFQEQQMATSTDVDKVQLQVIKLELAKENLENREQQLMMGLNLLMDLPLDNPIEVNKAVVQIEKNNYTNSVPFSIQLLNAKYNVIESEIQTLNRTRILPSAYLYGSLGTMGYGFDRQPNEFLDFYSVAFAGVKISYPLFNGTTTLRKVNQKKLALKSTELQKELMLEQTELKTQVAINQIEVAQKSIETTQIQIDLAKSIYSQTILQKKQEMASLSDVLIADNELRMAQQEYLTSIIDYLRAELELKQITGNIIQ